MLAAAVRWLRRSRYLFLVLCSPILLPFLFLVCAAELCLRLFRRCFRRRSKAAREDSEDERLRTAEEGTRGGDEAGDEEEEEIGLLQRYLEDQLMLAGSVYDCGDDCDENDGGFRHSRTPLLA